MLLFVDSMGHYTQPFMNKKWDVVSDPYAVNPADPTDTVDIVQGTTTGRFGGGGVEFSAPNRVTEDSVGQANDGQYIQKTYDGVSTIIVGLAVQQTGTQINGVSVVPVAGGRLLTFLDSATTQVGIDIMPSGQLRAIRSTLAGTGIYLCYIGTTSAPATLTELGTSTDAISSSSYDFLEFKITHHPSAGIVEVKRNGAAFWTLNNVNTAISGVNNSSSVLVGGYGAVWQANLGTLQAHYLRAKVSDFQLLNTTAGGTGDPVNFIGDRHWEPLFPLVDVTTDWTADPGPDNFANINTVPPDDTRNNNTEGVNDIDNYEFESALGPDAATMIFSYTMYLEKNTGGAVGISGQSVSNAMPTNGTEFQVPNPYAFRQSFGFIDPDTAAAWTVAAFNLANHGYERTA
jgi:hypothetical protein